MGQVAGRAFIEAAYRRGVPAGYVALKCRNWGLSRERAAEVAEDAAAEAFVRALTHTFESEAHFHNWVTKVACHAVIDRLRRERLPPPGPEPPDRIAPPPPDPTDAPTVAACLARLSKDEQEIVRLTIEEELTLDALADRLLPPDDRSANARRLQIKRKRDVALRRLRGYLTEAGFTETSAALARKPG